MHVYENEQAFTARPTAEGPGKYLSVSGLVPMPRAVARSAPGSMLSARRGGRGHGSVRVGPHPSLVRLFADHEGHIGLQASGWLPV
jgi:hypothetical protein